jgi:hypothetical protein
MITTRRYSYHTCTQISGESVTGTSIKNIHVGRAGQHADIFRSRSVLDYVAAHCVLPKWMREHDRPCPWSSTTCTGAAMYDRSHLELRKLTGTGRFLV